MASLYLTSSFLIAALGIYPENAKDSMRIGREMQYFYERGMNDR